MNTPRVVLSSALVLLLSFAAHAQSRNYHVEIHNPAKFDAGEALKDTPGQDVSTDHRPLLNLPNSSPQDRLTINASPFRKPEIPTAHTTGTLTRSPMGSRIIRKSAFGPVHISLPTTCSRRLAAGGSDRASAPMIEPPCSPVPAR